MRFGVHEAHGAANVIEYNWFKEHGIIKVLENGEYETSTEKLVEVTEKLLNELCRIEAEATQEEAASFVKRFAEPGQDILDALDKLSDIPIDIQVEYKL